MKNNCIQFYVSKSKNKAGLIFKTEQLDIPVYAEKIHQMLKEEQNIYTLIREPKSDNSDDALFATYNVKSNRIVQIIFKFFPAKVFIEDFFCLDSIKIDGKTLARETIVLDIDRNKLRDNFEDLFMIEEFSDHERERLGAMFRNNLAVCRFSE